MRHRLIPLFVWFILWSSCGVAATTQEPYVTTSPVTISPGEFTLYQWYRQYKAAQSRLRLDKESVTEASVYDSIYGLLSDSNISKQALTEYASGVYFYATGEFYLPVNTDVCPDVEPEKNPPSDDEKLTARMNLLSDQGDRIIYTLMELRSYVTMVNDPKATNDFFITKGLLFDDYKESTCKRIKVLSNALRPLATTPKSFNISQFKTTIKHDIQEFKNAKRLPYDAASSDAIMALHNYIPFLNALLSTPQSELREILLDTKTDGPTTLSYVNGFIAVALKDMVVNSTYVQLFKTYITTLPADATQRIESALPPALKTHALAALKAINDFRYVKEGDEIKIDMSRVGDIEQAYKDVASFVKAIDIDHVIENNSVINELDNAIDALSTPIDAISTSTCDDLKVESLADDWGLNRWGISPSANTPYGIRYTAKRDESTRRETHEGRPPYIVNIELLVHMPDIQHKYQHPISGETCLSKKGGAFSAIDLGINIYYVYKNTHSNKEYAKGYYIHPPVTDHGPKNFINPPLEPFKKAMSKIGLLGQWQSNKPNISLSSNFKDLSATLNLNGTQIPMPIVEANKIVFDPFSVGKNMCKQLERHVLPTILTKWIDNQGFMIGDWKFAVNTQLDSFVHLPRCNDFYREAQEKNSTNHRGLMTLSSSSVASELELLINGSINGERFDWRAQALVDADKNGISLKGIHMGDTPDKIKHLIHNKIHAIKSAADFPNIEGVDVNVFVNSMPSLKNLDSAKIPFDVQVTTGQCAAQSFSAALQLPQLSLDIDDGAIQQSIQSLASCKGKRVIQEHIVDAIDCDSLSVSFLGNEFTVVDSPMGTTPSSIKACQLNWSTEIDGRTIRVTDVVARYTQTNKVVLDFSAAQDNGTLQPFVESKIKNALGTVADKGLILTQPRFIQNAYLVDVTLKRPELGTIQLGTLTIQAEGGISLKSDLARIVANKISSVIEPALEKMAKKSLPDSVTDINIDVDFQGILYGKGLSASADVTMNVFDDIYVVTHVDLLTKFDVDFNLNDISSQIEATLKAKLRELLSFSNDTLSIQLKDIDLSPSYELTLNLKLSITLESLGSIGSDSVVVSKHGVAFKGRFEARSDYAFILFPAPVPVYLTRPGVFYDTDKEQIGALGALTVVAPPVDKLIQIDVELTTDQPDNFLSQLILSGDLILINSIAVIYAEGIMDFKQSFVTFEGSTSALFEKIISGNTHGGFNTPERGMVELNTALSIFGLQLAKTEFSINPQLCPQPCIKGHVETDFGIGKGQLSANVDPFIVKSELGMTFQLELFGESLGKAELDASIARAKVKATVFDALTFTATTPDIEQMTPEYIASIIASLLNIDLKDILNWLKNPDIKVAPAGDPSGGEMSASSAAGDSGDESQTATGGGDGGETTGGNGEPPTKEDIHNTEKTDAPPGAPNQRIGSPSGNAVRGCQLKSGKYSYGELVKWRHDPKIHYYKTIDIPSADQAKKICKKAGSTPKNLLASWSKGAFYIEDNYRPVRSSSTYYERESIPLKECNTVNSDRYYCSKPFPNHHIKYYQPSEGEEDNYRPLFPLLRDLSSVTLTAADGKAKEIDINIHDDDFDKFSQFNEWSSLSSAARKSKGINTRYQTLKNRLITALAKKQVLTTDIKKIEKKTTVATFFSDYTKVKVHYTIQSSPSEKQGLEQAVIWVSRDAQSVLLSRICTWQSVDPRHVRRSYRYLFWSDTDVTDCANIDKKAYKSEQLEQRVKTALGSIGVLKNDTFVDLNPSQTAWIIDDLLPSIIVGEEIPKLGQRIPIDPVVASCNPTEITFVEDDLQLTYRVLQTDGSTQSFMNIVVDKHGHHKYWADSDNQANKFLMGNFLACQPDYESWANENRIWLKNEALTETGTLLFYSASQDDQSSLYRLTEIRAGQPVYHYHVQRYNPYYLEKKMKLSSDVKLDIHSLVKGKNNATLQMYVNASQHIEVTTLTEGDEVNIEARIEACWNESTYDKDTSCGSQRPLIGADRLRLPTSISVERLNTCIQELNGLGKEATFPEYILLDNPVIKTGYGPLELFRKLSTTTTLNCSKTFNR